MIEVATVWCQECGKYVDEHKEMCKVQINKHILSKLMKVYDLWWNGIGVTESDLSSYGYISWDDDNAMNEACEIVEIHEAYLKDLIK